MERTLECEVCAAAAVRLIGTESRVELWRCERCGDLKRWCPRCDQGWIRRLRDESDGAELYPCDECEAAWPGDGPPAGPWEDLRTYLRRQGKPWSYTRLTFVRESLV
ncbi:MAG: hypothetical protein ACJ8GN_08765 [Longimicrobiaceae bacterium]